MRFATATALTLFIACASLAPCFAQDSGSSGQETASVQSDASAPLKPSITGGVVLGSDVFYDQAGTAQTWTKLGFQPDLSIGKIGIGLDLTVHFMLYKTSDQAVTIFGGDWIPNYEGNGKTFFDVYLPKIMYLRYGLKGQDPLFAKLGSIDDLSLGDGFIMSNYSNMHFLPDQRIFGLDLGLDGSLFNFPYVGLEAIAGNLARFDVVGARLYGRPLIDTGIPIIKNLQIGATVVGDTDPYLYQTGSSPDASPVAAYGADLFVPIIGGSAFPLAAFTDIALDPNESLGWMLGAGGKLIGIFSYGAQLRVLQDGFVPSYFDANYDLYRAERYDYMQLAHGSDFTPSWYASLGTSLFEDKLVFTAALDGPFSAAPVVGKATVIAGDAAQTDYPHLRGVLKLAQLDGFPFYFDASYDKYYLGAIQGFWPDLIDPTDAVIGLDLNYKTGASVLTLAYAAKWNPASSKFEVTSSLQAAVKF